MTKPIPAPFKWPGSKQRNAKRYPAPRYPLVVEPFAGSAGYSRWYQPESVWLNDLDPDVYARWSYLVHADPQRIRELPIIPPGQRVSEWPGLTEAERSLLRGWAGTGGKGDIVQMMVDGYSRHQEMPELKKDIDFPRAHIKGLGPAWGAHRRFVATIPEKVRHWKVTNTDYCRLPDIEATWFIDSPYQAPHMRKMYKHGKNLDYRELAAWCRSRRGQVIVCEAEGADWLPFRPAATSNGVALNADGTARKTVEVVWCSDWER